MILKFPNFNRIIAYMIALFVVILYKSNSLIHPKYFPLKFLIFNFYNFAHHHLSIITLFIHIQETFHSKAFLKNFYFLKTKFYRTNSNLFSIRESHSYLINIKIFWISNNFIKIIGDFMTNSILVYNLFF